VDSVLVKVTTDEGLEGWGEAFGFRAVPSVKLAIEDLIAPLCIGRDAERIASLMLEIQQKLHIFGRSGPWLYGLSAVDIGLWDIAGRRRMPRYTISWAEGAANWCVTPA
jgi:L-alanine-DL-glutamate epimerase-like enolase superfamily enzyme